MKLKVTLIIIAVLLVVGAALYMFLGPTKSAPDAQQTPVTLPASGSVPSTTTSTSTDAAPGTPLLTFAGINGATITTKDFIHNGETIPDFENPQRYLLAGSLGYCDEGQQCTAASSIDFTIFYYSDKQTFGISLNTEPIGHARIEAEQFLENALGLTQSQMCSLNYYVGTTYRVNSNYDDRNLGFSFCPGVTALPN